MLLPVNVKTLGEAVECHEDSQKMSFVTDVHKVEALMSSMRTRKDDSLVTNGSDPAWLAYTSTGQVPYM